MSERTRRLCSEIQLFDICSEDRCAQRDGKYCTSDRVLEKFEQIVAREEPSPDYLEEDEEVDGDDPEGLYEPDYFEQDDEEE